jgi:iron complex outermembrane receptor protein
MRLKLILALICLVTVCFSAQSQNNIQFKIVDKSNNEALVGATAYVNESTGGIADVNGFVGFNNITTSDLTVKFSFVGFDSQTRTFNFPLASSDPIIIYLESSEEEMEEIIITSSRSTRNIEDIPTRVEFLGEEELEEKAIMRSDNIAMLLRESTGIQMQVTSPSSANQSIRIQGLDGRYTQLLKDGFPLFGGFAGGLSIMQIPPLDLQQVEVIKGSNSTLYGGGAIAGLVNLISIRPQMEIKRRLMLDFTSAGGTTLNSFTAKRNEKFGYSFFVSGNLQKSYDVNGDNFSEIPKNGRITINPTMYFYPNTKSELRLSVNGTYEDRIGGNMDAIDQGESSANMYLQENLSNRTSYQLSYSTQLTNSKLEFKNSLLHFDRQIKEYDYLFDGEQFTSFSELNWSTGSAKSSWTFGANYYTDKFKEGQLETEDRSYSQSTFGVFVNQTATLNDQFSIESGLRVDNNNTYDWFVLPRLAFLYKVNPKLSMRIGGGLGYKTPTVFTEDSERLAFKGLSAFNLNDLNAEKSSSGNLDFNYKTALGNNWTFSLNQMFFYTQLNAPLVLRENASNSTYFFENADGLIQTQGIETNLKLTYKDFKFFLNYALIDTELKYDNINDQKPLTAKHNIGAVLVYEQEGKWRIGLESYYTGQQYRNDYSQTNDYWLFGLMALRKYKKISFYLNFENFTDTRQSKFEDIDLGSSMNPALLDVWAPLEGVVINGGIILDF